MSDLNNDASYCIGLSVGTSLASQGLDDPDLSSFLDGVKTALAGGQPRFSPDEANGLIQRYMQEAQARKFAGNKGAGEAFLADNATREGVTTLPSGLQYEVLIPGDGPKPTASSRVSVHYHGTLIDGTVFDSSKQRGQPASFGVTQVIAGWTEALQRMPVGATWKLFIPQELAYGASPRPGGPIQPFMALIFEVELLQVL